MSIKNFSTPTQKYKLLISSIHSLYRVMNSTFDMHNLLLRLTRLICQVLNTESCSVILLDSSKKYAMMRCLVAIRKKYCINKKIKITDHLERRLIETCSSVFNTHLLATPIIADDLVGIIIVRRKNKSAHFDSTDQKILMTLAEQSVMGIRNLQLYEEQQKIVLGSIKSLVTLMDARIPQEYTHFPYFNKLVVCIAQQLKLDERQIRSLQYASMLCDAGKTDIPLAILTKTEKLTAKERKIVKAHPVRGAEILRPLQILRPTIPIILYHHEKYDGTGYPSRLKGNQIPLGARIMAVADTFEALVYGRPYRERMNFNTAINEIKKKSGTQFDPQVIEAFLKAVKILKLKKYLQELK